MPFWESLKNYERYRAHLIGYNLVAESPVFSHQSAAIIQGLAVPNVPRFLHVYVPPHVNGPAALVKKHRSLVEGTTLEKHFSRYRTTGIEQTILDCATTLQVKESVAVVDSALNQRKVHFHQVAELLENASGRGCRWAKQVSQLMSPLAESPGESYVRLLLIEMGLRFKEQVSMRIDGRSFRVDFILLDYPVVIEFDGRVKVTDYGPADAVLLEERAREVGIQNTGWLFFRTGWKDTVVNPQAFKDKLWALLAGLDQMKENLANGGALYV